MCRGVTEQCAAALAACGLLSFLVVRAREPLDPRAERLESIFTILDLYYFRRFAFVSLLRSRV